MLFSSIKIGWFPILLELKNVVFFNKKIVGIEESLLAPSYDETYSFKRKADTASITYRLAEYCYVFRNPFLHVLVDPCRDGGGGGCRSPPSNQTLTRNTWLRTSLRRTPPR